MSKGNKIVCTGNPKGNFLGIVVSGTPKPGTCMTIKATNSLTGGLLTMEAYNPSGADDDPRVIAVLVEDEEGGYADTQARTTGDTARVYFPINGDMLNMLVVGQAGTGSANYFTIGQRFSPVKGTGKLTPPGNIRESGTLSVHGEGGGSRGYG